MNEPTAQLLMRRKGYHPCLFFICTHNHNHRHKCDQCQKAMLMGEEQVLTAYYQSTYDHAGRAPRAKLLGYDITCRHCHPDSIDKGFHYGELKYGHEVV